MTLSRIEAAIYGKRGGDARSRSLTWRVEGEYLTVRGIAERLDVSRTVAFLRLQRERAKPGALSWDALKTP